MKKILILCHLSFVICHSAIAQLAVVDAGAQTQRAINHAESLVKWTEQINKATEQVNKLNDMISQMNDLQGLIGKGMENVGVDPSITSTIDLAKAANNFGNAIQDLQHTGGYTALDLERMRQDATDPYAWQRYVILSKSYDATQKAQTSYDEQLKKLQQERAKALAQLKAAKSLGETSKAQASLDSIDAAAKDLAEERRRAFEQQQANYIENQNQREAWEQSSRDWTVKEMETLGKSVDNYLQPDRKTEKK
jgi:hypothetical protein